MNKLRYEKPFAEIVEFDTSDVVVAASGDGGDNGGNTDSSIYCLLFGGQGQGIICPLFHIGLAST